MNTIAALNVQTPVQRTAPTAPSKAQGGKDTKTAAPTPSAPTAGSYASSAPSSSAPTPSAATPTTPAAPAPTASTPASPAPATSPIGSDVLNVLIGVQAGIEAIAGMAEQALEEVIDRLEGKTGQSGQGQSTPPSNPAPPVQIQTPPPVVTPGDAGAAKLAAAQIAARLADESDRTAALSTLIAGHAQQQALQSEAGDRAGIAILQAMQANYASWRTDAPQGRRYDLAA